MSYKPVVLDPMRPARQGGLPTLDDVLKAAAIINRMPVHWMTSRDRTVAVANARWSYYVVARRLGFADKQIAHPVRRSRCSVQHGCRWGVINNPELAANCALLVAYLSHQFPHARFQ